MNSPVHWIPVEPLPDCRHCSRWWHVECHCWYQDSLNNEQHHYVVIEVIKKKSGCVLFKSGSKSLETFQLPQILTIINFFGQINCSIVEIVNFWLFWCYLWLKWDGRRWVRWWSVVAGCNFISYFWFFK